MKINGLTTISEYIFSTSEQDAFCLRYTFIGGFRSVGWLLVGWLVGYWLVGWFRVGMPSFFLPGQYWQS